MSRKATVMESAISPGAAELRFRGAWLATLGFRPGDRVRVESPAAGQLVLTVNPPEVLACAGSVSETTY
jgi:hypothetical protein